MKSLPARRRQRGIAALTAMLIVTLATVLAVELLWQFNLDLRRTEAMLVRDQAQQYALGVESWVIDLLRTDIAEGGGDNDNLEDPWAQDIPPLPIDGGIVEGFIVDLQGRFNLNKLLGQNGRLDRIAFEQFKQLLVILDLDPGLADAVVDWIDPDDLASLTGAEDDIYTSKIPPYRTANFWFTTPTELMAVEGFNQEIYDRLAPHLSVLPPMSVAAAKVNINTATKEVLQSLETGLTPADIERLVQDRPFDDRAAFQNNFGPEVWSLLDVATDYFGLTVIVSIGSTRLTMYSLLAETNQDVIPLLRSYDLPVPIRTDVDQDE